MQGKMVTALLQGRTAAMATCTSRTLPGKRFASKGLATIAESENELKRWLAFFVSSGLALCR